MKSRQMMSKLEPGALLRSICQAIHAGAGLQLGMTRRWLLTEGEPAARVALRDAGLTAASRVRKRQESGARS